MTIKKTHIRKEGGAAIADRLRLDAPVETKPENGTSVKVAFAAALIALAVSGILTYMLWKHWEYLLPC